MHSDKHHAARQQLADAELVAPTDSVVRSRLMEPGEIASPQRPALSLAVLDPKWVRAYVSEADLGKNRFGATARWTGAFVGVRAGWTA
jgi:HlyD family secretion protein